MVSYVPEGTHTVTPHLIVKGAAKAIDFYAKAFGAREHYRMHGPGGTIVHAEIQIGDSIVYLADEYLPMGAKSPKTFGGSPVTIHLYVPEADQTVAQAVAAGAKPTMPMMDMFWGDRYGQVDDPFGHRWSIATHKEDLSPAEMEKRGAIAMAEMAAAAAAKPKPKPRRKKAAAKPKRKPARKPQAKKKTRRR